jgi:hypothetical protein
MTDISELILVGEIKRLESVLIESQKMADYAAGAIQECQNLINILKVPQVKTVESDEKTTNN